MKIIESYKDFELTIESKKTLYSAMHDKAYVDNITKRLPAGKSVWIDSNGDTTNKNIVVFENVKWKEIFDPHMPIKFYKFFDSPTMVQAINKYINPTSIVIYQSEEFRYLTPDELRYKIEFMVDSYPTKIFIYVDMLGTDFNKLKYSYTHIIQSVITQNTIVHSLSKFKYLLEIN